MCRKAWRMATFRVFLKVGLTEFMERRWPPGRELMEGGVNPRSCLIATRGISTESILEIFFKSPEIRSVITLVSSSKCNETYRLKRRIINKLKVNKFQTSKGQAKMPICPLFCIKWKLRNQTAQRVRLGVHVSWALISWKAVEWIRRKIVRIYDVLFTVNVYVSE